MITFLTFHVDKKQANIGNSATLKADTKSFYHLIMELMFKSASLFHPQCKKVALSDKETSFDYLDDSVEIFRIETGLDNTPLMYTRLFAQLEYIKQHDFTSNLVFLDSDILINANLEYLFQEDFDVALTYRDYRNYNDMPINWGVMFICQKNKNKIIKFLENILKRYQEEYFTKDIFWGDQYALIDVIGRERFFKRSSDTLDLNDIKIAFVSADKYNFSPKNAFSSITKELKNKEIIHFKGSRKRLMQIYWDTYLANRDRSSWNTLFKSALSRVQLVYNGLTEVSHSSHSSKR